MLQLEKPFFAVGVDVIADGRSAQRDGLTQDFQERRMQFSELVTGERGSTTARTNTGPKQGLIGVDVAHATQQFLVEQRALDGSFPPVKQLDKPICLRFQRLIARSLKGR
jgi:hypothetical protein